MIALIYSIISSNSYAWSLIDVKDLDLEYIKLNKNNRDPYAPEYTGMWKEQIALKWDLALLKYGYWNNHVHTETVEPSGVVKGVGWQYELGIHVDKYVDIFKMHHSRHILDQEPDELFPHSRNQFPVEDGYGIRINLLKFKGR